MAHVEYRTRPIDWIVEKLGVPRHTLVWSANAGYDTHVWDGTLDPMAAIAAALAASEDVGVESGTGTGKSFFAGCLILWFLACWKGARVFTFAPKEDQLRLYIWTEIGKLWGAFQTHFPTAELTDLRIRMVAGTDDEDAWGAVGYAVGVRAGEQVATKAAGMHAEHMLIVTEETPGIHHAVLAAHENTCTADHNVRLALGNPDNEQDALHRFCTSPGVRRVRVSGLDHPNVVTGNGGLIPGAVSAKSIARRQQKYGVGSRLYDSRVRGICPAEAESALVKAAWVDAAVRRYDDAALRDGLPAWGVDVANSESGDQAAIARWLGSTLLEVEAFQCPDANVLGTDVVGEVRATKRGEFRYVGVDSVGVGAGTVNEAKRLGAHVQSLNGGARAMAEVDSDEDVEKGQSKQLEEEKYANLRAQMWWQMAQDLQHSRVALPADDELRMDLLAPLWWTQSGKIYVEPKEDLRVRLGRSPNKGDAAVYGNWVRRRNAVRVREPELSAFSAEGYAAERETTMTMRGRRKLRRPGVYDSSFGAY